MGGSSPHTVLIERLKTCVVDNPDRFTGLLKTGRRSDRTSVRPRVGPITKWLEAIISRGSCNGRIIVIVIIIVMFVAKWRRRTSYESSIVKHVFGVRSVRSSPSHCRAVCEKSWGRGVEGSTTRESFRWKQYSRDRGFYYIINIL